MHEEMLRAAFGSSGACGRVLACVADAGLADGTRVNDDLTCQRFLRLLGELADDGLSPQDVRACERHLEGCPDCRRYRADYDAAVRLARDAFRHEDAEEARLPDDLARSILSRIRRSN